jgi:hypothetical protein
MTGCQYDSIYTTHSHRLNKKKITYVNALSTNVNPIHPYSCTIPSEFRYLEKHLNVHSNLYDKIAPLRDKQSAD